MSAVEETTAAEVVPIDTSWLSARLAASVDEAWALALSCEMPDVGASLQMLHETLVGTRMAQERVEEIMAGVGLLCARARDVEAVRTEQVDDAWNAQAVRERRGFANDLAPRERYARYHTATVAETVEQRRAAKNVRMARAAEDAVKQAHRRLESTRWTLDARIRAKTLDTRLER